MMRPITVPDCWMWETLWKMPTANTTPDYSMTHTAFIVWRIDGKVSLILHVAATVKFVLILSLPSSQLDPPLWCHGEWSAIFEEHCCLQQPVFFGIHWFQTTKWWSDRISTDVQNSRENVSTDRFPPPSGPKSCHYSCPQICVFQTLPQIQAR